MGAVTLVDGVRAGLRMDPDRVTVGEVRGGEVLPMLLAMSQGNDGSMCSVHADSSKGVQTSGHVRSDDPRAPRPEVTNLLVANAIDVVVEVVGEGGETHAQLDELQRLDCDAV